MSKKKKKKPYTVDIGIFSRFHIPQMRRVSAQGHSVVEAEAQSPPPGPCQHPWERGPHRAPRAERGAFWSRHLGGESDETSCAAPSAAPTRTLSSPR